MDFFLTYQNIDEKMLIEKVVETHPAEKHFYEFVVQSFPQTGCRVARWFTYFQTKPPVLVQFSNGKF
jgi:hypothetical protein